jgi:hypothetical protein
VLRQMAGVIAADEAGIGLLAKGAGKHPVVEGGCPGFVDPILGMASTGNGKQRGRRNERKGKQAGGFHDRVPEMADNPRSPGWTGRAGLFAALVACGSDRVCLSWQFAVTSNNYGFLLKK